MRGLFIVGLILLALGVASLFFALPQKERHGVEVGDASVGIETTTSRKLSPYISGALIIGGALLMVAGRGRRAA